MKKVYKKLTQDQVIKRLLNDSFFNNSPYKHNEIRCTDKTVLNKS